MVKFGRVLTSLIEYGRIRSNDLFTPSNSEEIVEFCDFVVDCLVLKNTVTSERDAIIRQNDMSFLI